MEGRGLVPGDPAGVDDEEAGAGYGWHRQGADPVSAATAAVTDPPVAAADVGADGDTGDVVDEEDAVLGRRVLRDILLVSGSRHALLLSADGGGVRHPARGRTAHRVRTPADGTAGVTGSYAAPVGKGFPADRCGAAAATAALVGGTHQRADPGSRATFGPGLGQQPRRNAAAAVRYAAAAAVPVAEARGVVGIAAVVGLVATRPSRSYLRDVPVEVRASVPVTQPALAAAPVDAEAVAVDRRTATEKARRGARCHRGIPEPPSALPPRRPLGSAGRA